MADSPRRPRLEVALENLGNTCHSLQVASQAYRQARGLLEQLTATPDAPIEDAGLMLIVGDLQLPIPMPTDSAQRTALLNAAALDDAVQHLGSELVRLWQVAHETTGQAVEHCNVAAAAAAGIGTTGN